jgi:hypothetical protein
MLLPDGRAGHDHNGASHGVGQSEPGVDEFPQSDVNCIGFCSPSRWFCVNP